MDDDPIFSIIFSDYLKEKAIFDIRVFGAGEECIKNINDNPDFVILDYNLNSFESNAMNGIEILERMKKTDGNIMKGANYYIIKDTSSFSEIGLILED